MSPEPFISDRALGWSMIVISITLALLLTLGLI